LLLLEVGEIARGIPLYWPVIELCIHRRLELKEDGYGDRLRDGQEKLTYFEMKNKAYSLATG